MQIFRAVVVVLAALTAAAGITLDTLEIAQIDFKWWTLVAFIIFCVFMIWIFRDLNNKNRELENKKPSIFVEPVSIEDLWYLEVTNNGEKGVFSAEISIFDGDNHLTEEGYEEIGTRYNALWGKTNTNKSEIMNGQSDIVKLASITNDGKAAYFEVRGYDTINNCPYSIKRIELEGFREYTKQQIMQIVISSDPSPRNGIFKREYNINLSGMSESKPKERTSTPDKCMFGGLDEMMGQKGDFSIVFNMDEWRLKLDGGWQNYWEDESEGTGLILAGNLVITTFRRILIESVQLDIGGELSESNWESFEYIGIDEPSIEFYIPLNTKRGKRSATLKAIVNGKPYTGELLVLDLPQGKQAPHIGGSRT